MEMISLGIDILQVVGLAALAVMIFLDIRQNHK